MLTTIIFSKDRPLQLDLCLKSVDSNWVCNKEVVVLYDASNDRYEDAYNTLKDEHKNARFVRQGSFFLDLHSLIAGVLTKYISFLTDDDIVYHKSTTHLDELDTLFLDTVCCVSTRLGINIYRDNVSTIKQPAFKKHCNHLIWDRMTMLAGGYWNYPLSVDGHIFRTSDMFRIMSNLSCSNVENPNRFESILQRFFFEIGSHMICEFNSCVVNSPNNRVQDEFPNWNGLTFPEDCDKLLELYLAGKRIMLEKLTFNVSSPHQEVDILRGLNEVV